MQHALARGCESGGGGPTRRAVAQHHSDFCVTGKSPWISQLHCKYMLCAFRSGELHFATQAAGLVAPPGSSHRVGPSSCCGAMAVQVAGVAAVELQLSNVIAQYATPVLRRAVDIAYLRRCQDAAAAGSSSNGDRAAASAAAAPPSQSDIQICKKDIAAADSVLFRLSQSAFDT